MGDNLNQSGGRQEENKCQHILILVGVASYFQVYNTHSIDMHF